MNIFRRLLKWLRGDTPIQWECPLCHQMGDLADANDHIRSYERK